MHQHPQAHDEPVEFVRDGRRFWLIDGRELPVIHGGSDEGLGGGTATETAPAAAPETAPAAAPASAPIAAEPPAGTAPSVTAELDPLLDGDMPDEPLFSRSYVNKLREEAKRHRTEASSAREQVAQYESTFQGYEPADVEIWQEMITTFANDQNEGAAMMERVISAVRGGATVEEATTQVVGAQQAAQVAAEADAVGAVLSAEQVEAIVAERMEAAEAQRRIDSRVEEIFSKITGAGYERDSDDAQLVLYHMNKNGGDLDAALATVKGREQEIVNRFVAAKAGQGGAPLTPNAGVVAQAAPGEINSLEDASRATRAWLANMGDD